MSEKPPALTSNLMLYSMILPKIIVVARQHGYAVGVHGSMVNDLDLMLMPWIEKASSPLGVVYAMAEACGGYVPMGGYSAKGDDWAAVAFPGRKPHGRECYAISFGGTVYIDISVMPPGTAPAMLRTTDFCGSCGRVKNSEWCKCPQPIVGGGA